MNTIEIKFITLPTDLVDPDIQKGDVFEMKDGCKTVSLKNNRNGRFYSVSKVSFEMAEWFEDVGHPVQGDF